ncbi:protein involved in response to aluminum ion [Arthrobacter sp. Hiyo1]|nr:protein involved in response to aluminum ion [Arthrobacter sp. Hiyo1]
MVFFTPVILLMTQLAAPADPGVLVLERGVETFVGAVIGIAVAVLVQAPRLTSRTRIASRRGGADPT